MVKEESPRKDIKYVFVPMTDKAIEMGNHKLANMVSLGVLSNIEPILTKEILEKAVDIALPEERKKLAKSNIEAIMAGKEENLVSC